ncbi:hypothetical protein [Actinokineospora bangkokensis]|uniref:Uncharacterized protein n=1 Tax=Actinokineospora bangkokensis TaxID=1193682 RepID=A0A1Q9LJL8_9PSEU|nr:hypothetical protein [Actinokineospora bangkokensis]OLR92195.1 hypothetical protein BJP25_22980 [Actinokineospora bangkokensis]
MSYKDPSTGYVFDKGYYDFVDQANASKHNSIPGPHGTWRDASGFDKERFEREVAAWNEYRDEQVKRIESNPEYAENSSEYNNDVPTESTFQVNDDGVPPPPAVPGPGADGGKDTRVNTAALQTFAENMTVLRGHLDKPLADLDGLFVAPGTFAVANKVRSAIGGGEMGGKGLAKDTHEFIGNLQDALQLVTEAVGRMKTEYDSAEELNSMTSEKLNKNFSDVNSEITGLGATGSI